MYTFEQFVLQESQRGAKLGLLSRQPKDKLYSHSAAKSFLDSLKRSGENLRNYGITMTELPKVGINPQTKYETPIGVYFYPADYYYETIENGDTLPFQHKAKYINILKFKSSSNVLHLDDDVAKFEKLWKKLIEITKNEKRVMELRQSENYREYSQFSPAIEFFYAIIELSRTSTAENGTARKRNSTQSNRLLAKLGIDIVIDSEGKGIIQSAEPTQGFLIDGTKATVIRRIESTPPVHHKSASSAEAIMKAIQDDREYRLTAKEIVLLATHGAMAYKYAWHSQKRFQEGEPAIIKDVQIEQLYSYIVVFVEGPLPAAEDRIVAEGGAVMSRKYAELVLRGPFPKGEEVIAKDAGSALRYATFVLKGRFIKGEAAIMQNLFTKGQYLERFGPIDS